MQDQRQTKPPSPPHQKDAGKEPLLVKGSLEDESDKALLTSQLLGTEGAGSVEGVCAVWQRNLTPESCCLLWANMAARVKGVSRRCCIHVKASLAAQPKGDVRPFCSAHGTLPAAALPALPLFTVVAPVVVAVHVTTVKVHPGLLLVRRVFAPHGGEGQRVEANRTLWPGCVDLLPQCLQVFEGGGACQAFSCAPQQSGTTKVNERAINKLLTLCLHLKQRGETKG